MSELSKQARQDILDLTGAALTGILADHCHVRQIEGLICGQSVVWWVERQPPPPRIYDNTTVTKSDADFIFTNSFTNIDALKAAIQSLPPR